MRVRLARQGPAPDPDAPLVDRLRKGDEAAFMELVERYHGALVRLAQSFVPSRAVAEEVAQETWLGVLNGIDRFEGRSSLKTWIFRILVNRAKTRGERESRSVPFSSLEDAEGEPAVDPDRFASAGNWSSPPRRWEGEPVERLLAGEEREVIDATIAELPPAQRSVITLRDIEGLDADETCDLLDLTDGNQRVLLHRARSRVRQALEDYLS
ncbi:MAG TPA: sigma-70 family RNA polymerase sigma factor [Thermoleophilaceae bacterium]|nr:sigma-70 family RNA polymerase sigma factor [Thermoleophilaceae bacterium]